jgi:hypothetical protein
VGSATRRAAYPLGFGPDRVHRLHNLSALNAASVRAYSPPLLPRREYPDFEV